MFFFWVGGGANLARGILGVLVHEMHITWTLITFIKNFLFILTFFRVFDTFLKLTATVEKFYSGVSRQKTSQSNYQLLL